MTAAEDERRVRTERARAVALFRYQLVRQAADPGLSTRQRGRLVRGLAEREHPGPFGTPVRVSRQSLDRWITAWRRGGFDALLPAPRQVTARTPAEVLDTAAALKRENPARTAAQVVRILRTHLGWAPSESTVQRLFARLELAGPAGARVSVFGRFEAARPNELWTGDALHGPVVAGRKTYLFAFIDDHSRAVAGHRFGYAEDTVRLAAALRPALASRGVPEGVYVDNGSAFVDRWLLRACAVLGIKLTHSTPGRPQGRGKIERLFETVRGQFLVEITGTNEPGRHHVTELGELNRLFTAWVETIYHRAVHSETGQAPIDRWLAGAPFPLPTPAALREAFLWSEHRQVAKTATVSLHANTYQVDPDLIGRTVELVFDPFDLTTIEVRYHGKPMGLAVPHRIGRHAHPKARPETPPAAPPAASGITYLPLIHAAHQAELAAKVNYTALAHDETIHADAEATHPSQENTQP
jgi:putative transposase